MIRNFCGIVSVLCFLLIGCKETDGSEVADSDSSTSDPEGSTAGDSEVEDPDAWLDDFDAPKTWGTPENCGTIGDSCVNLSGCGSDTICQTEGWVCVPDPFDEARTRGPEYPYCMSYTCMTYEEASCYCAGVGAELYAACETGPEVLLGLCAKEGAECSEKECCGDNECIAVSPIETACQQTCETGEECASGCCTDLWGVGTTVCADSIECENPCLTYGSSCETSSDCCQGTCVNSEQPEYAGCRPRCTQNSDCFTGCCIPFSNSDDGFCADSSLCGCLAEGASCYDSLVNCCEGTACVGFEDSSTYVCAPYCTVAADCDSNCCLPVAAAEYSICAEASRCGL